MFNTFNLQIYFHIFLYFSYNEIWIPVPNIRRDSVCRSSFASDFDPFDETSFILSRQNSGNLDPKYFWNGSHAIPMQRGCIYANPSNWVACYLRKGV